MIQRMKKLINKNKGLAKILSRLINLLSFNSIKIGRGKNNRIIKSGSYMRKCRIRVSGENNTIEFGDMCFLNNCVITVRGNNNKLVFGKNVHMKYGDIYYEDDGNILECGDGTVFAGSIHLALTEGKRISIGKDCLFSGNITVRTGDSHSITDLQGNRINYGKDVVINDHVWVTNTVTLLKGAVIPENTVVGTGSVVTKAFDEGNAIISGNPASVIKTGVNWQGERI